MKASKVLTAVLAVGLGLGSVGCATNAGNGTLIGGAGGALAGAAIGSHSHSRAGGALIGGGVGALGGAIVGNEIDRQDHVPTYDHGDSTSTPATTTATTTGRPSTARRTAASYVTTSATTTALRCDTGTAATAAAPRATGRPTMATDDIGTAFRCGRGA